jgi:hypothetical protein
MYPITGGALYNFASGFSIPAPSVCATPREVRTLVKKKKGNSAGSTEKVKIFKPDNTEAIYLSGRTIIAAIKIAASRITGYLDFFT